MEKKIVERENQLLEYKEKDENREKIKEEDRRQIEKQNEK